MITLARFQGSEMSPGLFQDFIDGYITWHASPSSLDGGFKNYREVFAEMGQKFFFWWGWLYCWERGNFVGRGGSLNFEGKFKIA